LVNELKNPMRVFKSKWFVKFARKEHISDVTPCEALKAAEIGNIDADYGDGVIKQTIARPNKGKSGGYRTIIIFRRCDRAFFVYAFPKSGRANIKAVKERTFQDLARSTLALSDAALEQLIQIEAYTEVICDE